jgi:hypothetical protein
MGRWTKFAVKGLAGSAATFCLMAGAGAIQAQGTTPSTTQDTPTTTSITAQAKLSQGPPVTYDNKYEIYGGINLQNFQAGQDLPKRMNLGGIEVLGTYWVTHRLGIGADFRGEAGTTPVFPNPYTTRPLVVLYEGMAGAEYRGPKNQRGAINFHAYGGVGHGNFTETPLPVGENVGLYSNRTKPMAALGASIDFNRSKRLALRLSPDLILEHFGTETREFFAISGGVVYRIGTR